MKTQRTTRPALAATILLVTLFLLNGCAAPMMPAPAAPASSGGSEYSAPAPAAEAAAPAMEAPAEAAAEAAAMEAPAESGYDGDYQQREAETVTAGVTDDNEDFGAYLAYLDRHPGAYANRRDVSERYVITVVDEDGLAVHDAQVEITADERPVFSGRTDAGGRMIFMPRALDDAGQWRRAGEFRVVASKGYAARIQTFTRDAGQQGGGWQLVLEGVERPRRTQLDLLFLLDATGSMGDEIEKLKVSMASIADEIAALPEAPDVRFALVAYRDQGDEYVVRPFDFTARLNAFQRELANVRADGGGDTPEDVNTALHTAVHEMSWRPADTVRLAVLVGDAPPHVDYRWQQYSYDRDMLAAVGQGIKLFPVAASNTDESGEFTFRQMAQATGGKFVFLTYEDADDPGSGPGTETAHDVENYSVNTLDALIVRLVREELAKLAAPVAAQPQSPTATPTATPAQQSYYGPVSCTLDLAAWTSTCDGIAAIETVDADADAQEIVLRLTLDPQTTGFSKARFDVALDRREAIGAMINIGDSPSNDGIGGDAGDTNHNAEMVIADGDLWVFGDDGMDAAGNRQISAERGVVGPGDEFTVEVADGRLELRLPGGEQVIEAGHFFAFDGQRDDSGAVDYDLYAAFNRTIAGGERGAGVERVTITLLP